MEITFKRDLSNSYMIVGGGLDADVGYEAGMLQNNDVEHLLSFHTTRVNGAVQYWYDITGKRTLRDFFMQEQISFANLQEIFRGLSMACQAIADYLIPQDHLLFTADTIYVDYGDGQRRVYLCYCPLPGRKIHREFQSVTELLIARVNHGEEALRQACYSLYEASLSEEFSLEKAYDLVVDKEEKPQVTEIYEERCIQIHSRMVPEDEEDLDVDEEDDEEALTLWEQIRDWVKGKWQQAFCGISNKRKELFPLPSEEADFVFDAEEVCEAKTQMLSAAAQSGISKLVYEGHGGGQDIVLGDGMITIGSKVGENTVVIPSPAVSRYHARIRLGANGGYQLEDLNSTNGTYCNGELLSYQEPHTLARMDQIIFADEPYRVV